MELHKQLLACAVRVAGADADPEAIEADWRELMVGQPARMQDTPMMSVMASPGQLAGEGRRTSG